MNTQFRRLFVCRSRSWGFNREWSGSWTGQNACTRYRNQWFFGRYSSSWRGNRSRFQEWEFPGRMWGYAQNQEGNMVPLTRLDGSPWFA